jgi:heme b synthase
MDHLSFQPRLVFWELTRGCNLRCVHCRASATELSSPDDLSYEDSVKVIDQLTAFAPFILVLSGGEPLFRGDLFRLARRATEGGIRVALGTNGTLITPDVARQISEAGIRRVAISLDGPDPATHDSFRGIPGAFDKAIEGLENLKRVGMSVQINTTVAKHNAAKLPETLELALRLGADAFHLFLLVPVGCGIQIADKQMVESEQYEEILNWLYDRTLENRIELKATCAPHFFRVVRQRRAEARRRGEQLPEPATHGHGGHAPSAMNAMTRGCLAGTGVCFISHKGLVYPCGYLPLEAGNLQNQTFAEIWRDSPLFASLRNLDNLKGKCGICEFRNICEGCRARAFGCNGDYLAEEPFCLYTPREHQPAVM